MTQRLNNKNNYCIQETQVCVKAKDCYRKETQTYKGPSDNNKVWILFFKCDKCTIAILTIGKTKFSYLGTLFTSLITIL